MIQDLFTKDRALYVRFDNDRFRIGRMRREHLDGIITDILPVRKRFDGTRLVCWSNDGVQGKHGQRCALCRHRWGCAERVRLMMLLDGLAQEPRPAILEIGHGSFDALDRFIDQLDNKGLQETTVRIQLHRSQGRLRFSFEKAS